ncbi:hypothetical protein NMG60_11022865 [Bertholletia excelsa]
MKEGILEVLVVNAKGIKHTNVIGRPAYYVIIECGTQVQRGKTSRANHKEICWNEKFAFEFPFSEWENLTHLRFKIMDEEYFNGSGFVGETLIYIQGIIMEGKDRGFLEIRPTPYNVVLEDDTYKGEIKIGLRFFSYDLQKEHHAEKRLPREEEQKTGQSICGTIANICKIPWRRLLSFCNGSSTSDDKQKDV